MTRIVVALGGNAILAKGARGSVAEQRETVRAACDQLVGLVADGHELVVTHGNGPQVGRMLVQQRAAQLEVPPMPLDVLDAQTQGQIGYLLAQQLGNALRAARLPQPVAAVVTQVVVDPGDPAFGAPDKPVGPHYTETELEFRVQRADGEGGPDGRQWEVDGEAYHLVDGGTWRRVVPSPQPLDIVEVEAVRRLMTAGILPICAGGGGCPVASGDDGRLAGVEAVVDKDRTAALLARLVDAEVLLILTDVEQVLLDYGTDSQRPLGEVTVARARELLDAGQFPAGSMGPKISAAAEVAERGGQAVITSLGRAADALRGNAGTRIVGD
ncbi:MAG: carbamate kinase [Euzebyales bacterium]|nr:carbamate kinase [Euzebyales bacterium]